MAAAAKRAAAMNFSFFPTFSLVLALALALLAAPVAADFPDCSFSSADYTVTSSCKISVVANTEILVSGFLEIQENVVVKVEAPLGHYVHFKVVGTPGSLTVYGTIDASDTVAHGAAFADQQGVENPSGASGAGHAGRGGRGFGGDAGGLPVGEVQPATLQNLKSGAAGGLGNNASDTNYGGGILAFEVGGLFNLLGSGIVRANGGHAQHSSRGGGGSGGHIHIVAASIGGQGLLEAIGGNGDTYYGGGGAGGRISTLSDTLSVNVRRVTHSGMSLTGTPLIVTAFTNFDTPAFTYTNYRVCPYSDTTYYCGPQCQDLPGPGNCSFFDAINITKCNCGTWTFTPSGADITAAPATTGVVRWNGQSNDGPGAGFVGSQTDRLRVQFESSSYISGITTKGATTNWVSGVYSFKCWVRTFRIRVFPRGSSTSEYITDPTTGQSMLYTGNYDADTPVNNSIYFPMAVDSVLIEAVAVGGTPGSQNGSFFSCLRVEVQGTPLAEIEPSGIPLPRNPVVPTPSFTNTCPDDVAVVQSEGGIPGQAMVRAPILSDIGSMFRYRDITTETTSWPVITSNSTSFTGATLFSFGVFDLTGTNINSVGGMDEMLNSPETWTAIGEQKFGNSMTDTCEFKRVNLNGVRTAGTCPSNIDIGADVGRFDAPATSTVPGDFSASLSASHRHHDCLLLSPSMSAALPAAVPAPLALVSAEDSLRL
jgi:hypothetical protein